MTNIPEPFKNFSKSLSVQSPGRINLIGEHTDYNLGFVLPTAINKTIDLHFAANRTDFSCNVYSKTFEKYFSFDLREISRSAENWQNYILGVVNEIQKRGKTLKGFDCIIESNLPVGAGISSSAALECGIAFGLNELFKLGLSRETMAELSRDAEHTYVGTKCGIMDQYASILSKENHLILLDCQNLVPTFVPANFEGHEILLLNTMVSHNLASSEYNTRRQECEEVVAVISQKFPRVSSLRDINFEMLEDFKEDLSPVHYNRALYVLKENTRVIAAVEALKKNDLEEFGNLMYASHLGLRDLYNVSCRELDFLVDFSKEFQYVKGARMMGGGFGGCTINLLEKEQVKDFITKASEAYFKEFGINPQAIPALPGRGTMLV